MEDIILRLTEELERSSVRSTPRVDISSQLTTLAGCHFDDVTSWNKELLTALLEEARFNSERSIKPLKEVFNALIYVDEPDAWSENGEFDITKEGLLSYRELLFNNHWHDLSEGNKMSLLDFKYAVKNGIKNNTLSVENPLFHDCVYISNLIPE